MSEHLRDWFKRLLHLPYIVQSPVAQRQILDLLSVDEGVRVVIDIDRAVDLTSAPGKASIKVYWIVGLPSTEPVLKWAISTFAPPVGVLTPDLERRVDVLLALLESGHQAVSDSPAAPTVLPSPATDPTQIARIDLDAMFYALVDTIKAQIQALAAKLSHLYLTFASPSDQARLNTMRVEQVEREAVEWAKAGAPGWASFVDNQQVAQNLFAPPQEALVLPEPVALYLQYVRGEAVYHGFLWLLKHLDTLTPSVSDEFARDVFLRDQS